MLKHRLIFGSIMLSVLAALLWLDSVLKINLASGQVIHGSIITVLLALLVLPAQFELKEFAKQKNTVILLPITVISTVLISANWYVKQFASQSQKTLQLYYHIAVLVFSIFALLVYQARKFGTEGTFCNCSVSLFSVFYLGLLGSFILAIRIEYGIWALIMFIITVKFSDIGAYTMGRIFGKHKFAPNISPGKTWEGLIGACIFASFIAILFSFMIEEVKIRHGLIFGIIFALVGQLGDLAESMLKRDAQMKDSSSKIPGFGGVLDIVDSPLVAAPVAYLFFKVVFEVLK